MVLCAATSHFRSTWAFSTRFIMSIVAILQQNNHQSYYATKGALGQNPGSQDHNSLTAPHLATSMWSVLSYLFSWAAGYGVEEHWSRHPY